MNRIPGLVQMACKTLVDELSSQKQLTAFVNSIDYILTDCDGVIWIGDDLLPGAADTFNLLRKLGKKIGFVTNNSTKSTEEYMRKFTKLGLDAKEEELFCTSYCVAAYLKSLNFDQKVYLVGSTGTSQELDKAGIKYLPIGPDPILVSFQDTIAKGIDLDESVGAVVVAFDEHLSFLKMTKAISYLDNPNCLYVASNTDEQFPSKQGRKFVTPGTGTIVAAITTGAARDPVIVGKPSRYMFDCIKMNYPDITPERTLMIGDRLNTDIAFGRNIGCRTLLTLSGVTTRQELTELQKSANQDNVLPDYVCNTLADFYSVLKNYVGP